MRHSPKRLDPPFPARSAAAWADPSPTVRPNPSVLGTLRRRQPRRGQTAFSSTARKTGECIGVVKGLTAAALAQGVDPAMRQVKGIYRKSDPNGQVVRIVIKYIDQHPPENTKGSEFALLALRGLQ